MDKLCFEIVEFDSYYEIAFIESEAVGYTIQMSVAISKACYDEKKGEWDDYKMCDEIDKKLEEVFGKGRAKVERYEVITPDTLPPAYHYTL